MTIQIKLTDDLLSRIEHAMSFFNQCRPREGFSVEERNAIRALRDIASEINDHNINIADMKHMDSKLFVSVENPVAGQIWVYDEIDGWEKQSIISDVNVCGGVIDRLE